MDLRVTLPDEHHSKCGLCDKAFQSERELEKHAHKVHSANVPSPPKISSVGENSAGVSFSADDDQMATSFSPENSASENEG
uniref:C2H2-type domain-containing protein n=1 Tax=Romanomermis culicivorax TaxID=13658 RepID=A0A915IM51_ROMCU